MVKGAEGPKGKKRKSTDKLDAAADAPNPAKRRRTLDSFFTHQVSTRSTETKLHSKDSSTPVTLNEQQVRVLQMVEEGKNVFFTGAAGSGKSLLLEAVITALRKKYAKNTAVISVTASTGMAASNIGGTTIHSWGAITPGIHDLDRLLRCIKTCKPALRRWQDTKVLVMDEVSMVDGQLFDTLEKLAVELRRKKRTNRPFGGIQLVVAGDFFQLPPVTSSGEEPFFAFDCDAWKRSIDHVVTLTQVYRQKDTQFVELLNELRKGTISPAAQQVFTSLSRPLPPLPSGIVATELYPLRAEVEHANTHRLATLPGPVYSYTARNTGTHQAALDHLVVPAKLRFKADAQVMLVKNMDENLVNGTVGRILGFHTIATCQASLDTVAATSASPSPQSTIPSGSPKAKGAVRNVRVSADGRTPIALGTASFDEKENIALAKGRAKDEERYPLVEFCTQHGSEVVLVVREEFRVDDNEGTLLARRVQLPLVLAWAMSIHKSQGQTLEHVKINLGHVFEKGQSYVALSRAASLDGLQVLGFDPKKVKAHPRVIAWSESLSVGR